MMKGLNMGIVLFYIWSALFSCSVPTPARNYTIHWSWNYNCSLGHPQSFEYGTSPDRTTLVKMGSLTVSSCTSNTQSFQASVSKIKTQPATGTIYYVRAVFPGNVFSDPDFKVQ